MQMSKFATAVGSIAALFAAMSFDGDTPKAPLPPAPTAVEIADAVDHAQQQVDAAKSPRETKHR